MSVYNLEFNKDDSVIRALVIALLAELKEKIYIFHITNQVKEKIYVPFYASVVGQEGFLLDHFLNDEVTDPSNDLAIGTYDVVPRGIISYSSLDIDSGSLVNKFVRMEKMKKENNQLVPYSYETMIIPVNLSFETKIVADSFLQMMKIVEACMKILYKNNQFKVDLGGYHVAGTFTLPESLDMEKLFEFSFSDEKLYNVNFTLEMSSFIPVFDESTEVFVGSGMETLTHSVKDMIREPVSGTVTNQGFNIYDDNFTDIFPNAFNYVPPTDIEN